MKTTMKALALIAVILIAFAANVDAQSVSAAMVDQTYGAGTGHYKMYMIALAAVYGLYLMVQLRRRREIKRFMGKI